MKPGADGMVVLFDVAGNAHKRYPIDARAMLERGGYTLDGDAPVVVPAAEPSTLKAGDIGPTGAPVVIGKMVPVAERAAAPKAKR